MTTIFSKINQELIAQDKEIPPTSFDLDGFANNLSEVLKVDLKLEICNSEWKTKEEIKKGLKKDIEPVALLFSPITSPVFWLMDKEDRKRLISFIFKDNFTSLALEESFYNFLILQSLDILKKEVPFSDFSIKMVKEDLIDENAFCLDIKVQSNGEGAYGRLVLPFSFRKAFRSFAKPPRKTHAELNLGIEIGALRLPISKLKGLKKGDFLIPDTISYDQQANSGTAILTFKTKTICRVELKQNTIKIIDFDIHQEEQVNMEKEESIEEIIEPVKATEPKLSSIEELSVPLKIELTRFNISIEKLSTLAPGNFLEISSISPEKVNLVVNGSLIGRGELVYLGETLGVRISEIAK